MVSKNNKKLIAEKNRRNEKQRFAIRKLNIGVASVLLGITFSIYGGGQAVAHADTANASDQVAASDTGDNSLADKSEVALSNTALNASQSSTSATSANGAVQSQSSANSQPAATASDNAVASSAAVEATKDQSTAENQPSAGQEVQTPAQAQPVVQENGSGDTSLDATRQVLNAVARRNSNSAGAIHLTSFAAVPASTPAVATSDATAEDTNAVTVTDAQGLIDAIQKGSATTINVANDINLAKVTDSNYTYIRKINTRDFTIKSATNGVKHTIDFSGYVFNMSTPNTVTFKDLDIYARSYWGVVYNAGGYVYDNVNFTGSQLIYTASNTDATVTFKNKVTATTVGSYTSPIDGKSRSSQGGDTQQILQFEGGTNQIIFDENSDVTLGTTNSNVLEVDRGTATIDVKNGANVTINPHSKGNPENRNGIGTGSIARAIASNANTTINVDKGANLTINTEKASGDSDVAGALYLNSDATLNVNGDLNINSTGTPSTKNDGYPVYIAGNAAINVGNGGKFNLSATNTGSYNDNLMSISGKGTVKLAPHSNFKISGDGTGALTAINLSSGSTFTSDQPDLFTIDLSANTSTGKSLIKNGTIHFTRVKTVTDGNESQPLGKIDVTYDRNGNATSYTITAQDENTVKQVGEGLANKNLIDLVKAGEDVTLSNLHLSKNNVLTGTVASSGSDNPIYVTVKVGKGSANVPVIGNYTVYTNTNGTVTSNNVDYAAETASTGGNFSIDLSKLASSLTDDAQVAVTATKDFVEAAQTESVAALRALNTTTLQELVDDAPTEEAKPSYYNATAEAQKAYIDAISTGKDILANPNNYDQVDVDDAVTAIQTAQKALTGKETNKTELQDAIDQASTVESSNNYINADSNLQKAYTDAISAGQTVLSNDNATQTEVDNALTTINNAKDALNGDAKKAASKEALQKAVAEAPTVKSDDAAYYNGSDEAKAAYDKAISAGQTVLDNSDATATQITDALNAINTAKGNLKGEATDKSVLQKVVDNSATVKESNNYTNADETQKTAYDNAVTAAQTVLDKTNATQAEVNQALQDLETANNNLNGDAKTEAANKAALEAAVKDAPNVRNTPAYYNGSKEAQTAYNNAINAGQAVLNETNPFASDVKNALDAINAAKDNLKGETTSTEALETALTNANNAKETGNYANADQANQEALNNAINAGQEILKNTNATQAEVDNAAKVITDAINGLNGDTNLANAKNAATEDIQKALDTKTTEITDATNIDQATKDQLIADAKKAAEDANTAINQATNANAVNTAKTEGITKINNVKIPSLDDAKTNAAKEIDQALTDKTKEITDAENIDQTTKDQLIKEATDAATTAKDAIEKSTTNDEATKAGQAGVDAINNVKVPSVTDSQNAAKDAIDDAFNAKTKEINDANNIDQTTKDQLIKEATDAANNAKEAIDKATTADAIKTAQDEGTTNINNVTVPSLEDAKKAANKAVDDALTAQTEVINKADNLSDAEKKDLIDQATNEANKAKDNIETATTNNEATKAGQAGVDAIKKIVPTSLDTVKSDANKAIDDALTKKLEEINSANALTTDEKNALTQEANTAADKAKKEITKATTNDAVIEAQNNGVTAIDGIKVPTESAVKEAAKKAVAEAAEAKNNAINASNLTAEEKAALKQKVTEAENAADQAIDNATTNAAVTEAQNNGIKAINGIEVTTSTAKEAAKKAVAEAATAKNNAIDSSNLTNEEKTALKQEVTDAQNAANTAIDNATTNAAVTEAEDNGIKAINGIEVPTKSAAKEQATTDLNDAVDDAKKAIDQDSNLTDEEKQAAKDQIDSDAKKAQEVIDNAKTADEVKTAVDNGQLAIDKDVANAAIDNAVAGKKAEIAKAPLTTDEAKALNDLVDQEAKAAKKAIDSATTIPAVEDAKNTGVAAINDIAVPTTSSTKDQANQTIDDALANKTKEINDATNLSNKQKQDLIDEATEEAAKAKENIKNATSNEAVNKATTDGVDAIANVTVPSLDDAKKDASQLIDDVLKQKEAEINNASHLTDQEKQDLIHQAQNAADEAKDKINQATTNDDVATERDAGAEKIANIAVPSLDDAKDKATKAIDDALADKTKEINEQTHLSDQEKNDLIKQITDIADKAKDKINNDSNDAEVVKDEKEGIDAIVDTKVPGLEDHKQNAIKSLDEAKSTKLVQIDEAGHLTADEKANLTQQVDAEYNKALDNINKATTNDDADKASADGVEAILNIAVPSLNEKKQDSIDALNEVRDAKKEEINNANNLNQDEKDELTKQVDQIADNAINAINGAKDDQTAKNAENKGIQDILDVKVPSLDEVKTNAKQAIADALESKTNEINAASNLDSATKQELINRANAEADTAIEKIDQATSNDQALAASQAGVDKILGIEVPTLADAKQSAIDAINDALKQKETEINNASQLTSDEKQNLINQVNSIADNAKNAINNATTNQSVEETKNAGIEKINAINVPTTSATKDEAIKAIDDALTNKVNEINNATNITADEKANLIDEANNAANTAKDNITKATSDSEVATATTDGINAIANVTVPSLETAKDQAKNLIDDVLNEKKNEINNADNLSDSQKQDLINQATDEADQAKKNIDNATTNNDVQTAEDNGAQAIENVTVPSLDEAKKASTKVIDEVLKEKTAEINAATNLSNTEKDALIKDATTAANTAKDNIAKATTNDAVKDAETDGVKAILDIKVPGREDQQKDAIAALDRALADKVSEIDNANNLSETTKQDLKQQAQAAYTTAVDNVNNAQTSAEINAARDNGVQAILDITVPTLTDAQDASITAVEQVRDAKKTQIEAAKNLTETQKEALKNQVDEIADKAIDNIKNATTDATVKDAETAGINEILNVTIPTLDAAKSDAKQAIADALTAKTAEINAAQNLTDAEKQKLIDQAQTEAAAANKKIDAATTNDAAELAAKNGVQAILDIQVPTVEETRDQAKKNVDNALNSKKEEINNSNLSPAAKEALINEAEQAAENARTAIDNATTASAISEAEAAGIAAIENIKVANAPTESDNSSNHQTNTETPTEGNSTSQDNNNATQAPVQGNNTQADLTGSHGTNLTTGQQTEKAADTNSKETLPQTGNETERGLSIAGLAIASLLGLFGLSGLGKKRD